MLGLLCRHLEVGDVQAKAAFVLRRVHRHPHSLRRREILLPRQSYRSSISLEELADVTHSSSTSNARSSSWKLTSTIPPPWRNSRRPRCDAPNARSNK